MLFVLEKHKIEYTYDQSETKGNSIFVSVSTTFTEIEDKFDELAKPIDIFSCGLIS